MPDDARPWSLLATSAWCSAIALVFALSQTAVFAAWLALALRRDPGLDLIALAAALPRDGRFLAAATLVSTPAALLACAWAARRHEGWTARAFLALERVAAPAALRWLGAAAAAAAGLDLAAWALGRPIVPPFVAETWRTGSPMLLLPAFVAAAPAWEEVYFRGFLWRRLERSRLGVPGAWALTSLAFAGAHLQYDAFGLACALALGGLLGAARRATGSTAVTFGMHALFNAWASAGAAYFSRP